MSVQVETLEKNMAKLTVEIEAERLEKALDAAYNKQKKSISMPGFRKGKVPRAMVEKMYGVEVFYEDAVDEVIDASYPDAAKESGLEIVSQPSIDVVQLEKGKPFIYTAEVAVKPEVTLGQYKGVEVQKTKSDVTEEDIETEIKRAREKNSRLITVEDRGVEDGDQVTIDFDGSVDGKRFEGGKAEDYPLTIGSHTFIDNFEEQLIGKKTGEECEVNVTFPAEYHVEELKNKPAVFKVKVKEIQRKELPEANDEFASEVSDFDTLDEYKADIRKKLQEKKEQDAKVENENNVIEKVVENAQMELPQPMVDTQAREMVENYARRLQSQGLNINDYMKYTGMTPEKLMEQMRPEAEKRIKTRLVLEKVVEVENVEVSDEKLDEQINEIAASYKLEGAKLKEMMGEREKEQIREDLKVQAAIDLLVEQAKLA